MCLLMILKKSPIPPSGVQLAIVTIPPGAHTRASSAAVTSWRGANIAPIADSTRSKRASSNGSASGVGLDPLDVQALRARCGRGPSRGARA